MNWKIYFIMLNNGEKKTTFLRHLECLSGPSPPLSPSFLMKYADYVILSRFSLSLFICLYSKLVKMILQSVPILSLSVPSCIIVEKMRVNVTLKGPCIYFQTKYSNIFHQFIFFFSIRIFYLYCKDVKPTWENIMYMTPANVKNAL